MTFQLKKQKQNKKFFLPHWDWDCGPLEPKARAMSYTDNFEVKVDKSYSAFIELLEKFVVEYNLISIPYYQR